jgi:hypothetical protein
MVLCHHLLARWPVYRVGTHSGCVQGTCMPLTPFYSVAIAILGFGFCLDSICHQTVRRSSVCETPSRNQVCLIASPVLACVLDCLHGEVICVTRVITNGVVVS